MHVSFSLDVSDLPLADAQIQSLNTDQLHITFCCNEKILQSSLQMHLP